MIRFPLEITESARAPEKPESWSNVIGKGLIAIAFILLYVIVVLDNQ